MSTGVFFALSAFVPALALFAVWKTIGPIRSIRMALASLVGALALLSVLFVAR